MTARSAIGVYKWCSINMETNQIENESSRGLNMPLSDRRPLRCEHQSSMPPAAVELKHGGTVAPEVREI